MAEYIDGRAQRVTIITGIGSGVDAVATKAARTRVLAVQVMPASFDDLGDTSKSAARNQRLIDACDVLVAFWDGASAGTRATVDRDLNSGKEVHVFLSNMGRQ